MSNDIYKAPEAELVVDNSDVDELFTVSTRKLWIMHLLTFSVYDVYWFYRHWDHQNQKHNLGLWPAVRGLFFVFFIYSLFKKMQDAASAKGLQNVPNLKLLALLWYFVFLVQIGLTAYYRDLILTTLWLSLALSIVGNVISGFIFASVQRVANRVLDDEQGSRNSRITVANIAWIIVVLLYNALSMLGAAVQQAQ